MTETTTANVAAPFAGLTPDVVLDAIDTTGLYASGQLLALNSYENRVFQVGLDEPLPSGSHFVVLKFYRPGRWTHGQILEEHAFTAELAELEIPAVPPMILNDATLHTHTDLREPGATPFHFAVFERRGGRAPELSDRKVRERLGRFIGRLHAAGGARPFVLRPELNIETFGTEPSTYLLAHDWLPAELREIYRGVVAQALDGVAACYARAGEIGKLRLHGDCHEGNVLWSETGAAPGPHFVDFDDSRTGPAVQDLWMLLSGTREEMQLQLGDVLDGYEDFAEFDRRELHLVEALRSLRLIHYSAWIARRWHDPAFPAAFPWFGAPRYWEDRILELREQIAAMQEAPLIA